MLRVPCWAGLALLAGLAGCGSRNALVDGAPATVEAPRTESGVAATGAAVPEAGQTVRSTDKVEVLSKVYEIDRIYKSMTGPWSRNDVRMLDAERPELVWITGAHVEMVDRDARDPMPELFMCHANLDLNIDKHRELFGFEGFRDTRLFTLSQGQLEVKFPPGFGIPVMSDEALELITQVLNLNFANARYQVRHRVTLDYVRDRDATQPMTALYQSGVFGLKTLEDKEVAFDSAEGLILGQEKCTSCCLPGKKAVEETEGLDRFGRRFTGHWIVKPGREVSRTRATTMFNLTADTRIHFIAVHLHPFAESLELCDLTSGETIFRSQARNLDGQIGLAHVDSFESVEGVPVYLDHEYEVVSTYDNTSNEDQDSMAVMYVYLFDPEFKRPEPRPVAQR